MSAGRWGPVVSRQARPWPCLQGSRRRQTEPKEKGDGVGGVGGAGGVGSPDPRAAPASGTRPRPCGPGSGLGRQTAHPRACGQEALQAARQAPGPGRTSAGRCRLRSAPPEVPCDTVVFYPRRGAAGLPLSVNTSPSGPNGRLWGPRASGRRPGSNTCACGGQTPRLPSPQMKAQLMYQSAQEVLDPTDFPQDDPQIALGTRGAPPTLQLEADQGPGPASPPGPRLLAQAPPPRPVKSCFQKEVSLTLLLGPLLLGKSPRPREHSCPPATCAPPHEHASPSSVCRFSEERERVQCEHRTRRP